MAGKKDKAVVAVISNLTLKQASEISKKITNAKGEIAPNARGTIKHTNNENVGNILQGKRVKKITTDKKD